MKRVLPAGSAYFALVFALGFMLGTVRVLWLVPIVGELPAVIAELPIMLTASWFAAGWLVRRFALESIADKAAMGVLAFLLLMAAEAVLGVFAFGQPLPRWFAELFRIPGIIGLAGQMAFAAMPMLRR